jgi:alkaline phosphatase D
MRNRANKRGNTSSLPWPWNQPVAPLTFSAVGTTAALSLLLLGSCPQSTAATDFDYPNTTLTRLAFGSCHKNKYADATSNNIWRTIEEKANPQLWLWTGDVVYPPTRGIAPSEMLQVEYRQMLDNVTIGYSTFRPLLGTFGTWDDHDYGGNDAGDEMPDKQERAKLYWDFLGHRQPRQRQGVYSSITIGRPPHQVKIILLDTRWHRQAHCVPSIATKIPLGAGFACLTRWLAAGLFPESWCSKSTTLLGEEQWEWFQDEFLNKNDGDEDPAVTLVVSSVQVLTTNPAMEGWGHFPAERDRLMRLLSQKTNRLVFCLSGDVHHAEILDPMPSLEHRFLEITSSGLTHDCSKHIYGKACKPLLDTFARHRFDSPQKYVVAATCA